MGHRVTLADENGETETLGRYPDHGAAKAHVADYCRWDDAEWDIADSYQRAKAEDGRQLTITPTAVDTRFDPGHVDTDPRHGVLEWADETTTLADLDTIPCDGSSPDVLDRGVHKGTLAIVLPHSDLDAYFGEHKRGEETVPSYYSRFPDDRKEPLVTGPPDDDDDDGATGISAGMVEAAIRVLNGSGRYSADEYTIHNCLPMPSVVERAGHGAVVIAPLVNVSDK